MALFILRININTIYKLMFLEEAVTFSSFIL